jgi:hypothetical protein
MELDMNLARAINARLALITTCVAMLSLGALAPTAFASDIDDRPPTLRSCNKIKGQAMKATGAKRTALLRQYAFCMKQYRAGKFAMAAFTNGHYTGARSDGETVDDRYCRNGTWASDINSEHGDQGRGWYITNVKVVGKNITHLFMTAPVDGGYYQIAYRRISGKWEVGVAFGDGYDWGAVTRTNAAAEC